MVELTHPGDAYPEYTTLGEDGGRDEELVGQKNRAPAFKGDIDEGNILHAPPASSPSDAKQGDRNSDKGWGASAGMDDGWGV